MRSLHVSLLPLLAVSSAVLAAGCSGEPTSHERSSTAQQAIIGGPKDTGDAAAVMVIIQEANNPTSSSACTGTVISPHVVLTAAHCLDERIIGKGKSFYVFLGDDVDNEDQLAEKKNFGYAKTTQFHPEFDPSSIGGATPPAHDIGVIVLLDKLPVTPIALQRDALSASVVGQMVHAIGFGKSDATKDTSSGIRRDNTTPVVGYDAQTLWTEPPAHGLCEGDSGGPSYLTTADGKTQVAGVHSYVEHNKSCTGKNYDTRVDVHVAWIEPFVRSADPGFLPDAAGGPSMPDSPAAMPAEPAASPADAQATKTETTTTGGCATSPARGNGASLLGAFAALAVMMLRRARRTSGAA